MSLVERMEGSAPLARWGRTCWIDPDLLATLKTAAMKLPEEERADVHGAILDAVAGKTVLALTQIPPRLLRALGL